MHTPIRLLSAALLSTLALLAQAETRNIGDYTIHYSVVNSTFISPAVAEQYGITRGSRQAFLNVSVQKQLPEGAAEAVTANIQGSKRNLMQQSTSLDFKEVREGEAIYYIGQFEFSNTEPVVFSLEIQPENQGPSHELEWQTRVYINHDRRQ